jgi:regulator of nucleoside diphosphate kinase
VPLPPVRIEADEYERLAALAGATRASVGAAAEALLAELDRAQVVPAADFPANAVRMGSEVTFRDEATGQVQHARLVYPGEADISTGCVSVLAPIGAALIGLSVGQTISWAMPNRRLRTLTILDVAPPPSPEPAAG